MLRLNQNQGQLICGSMGGPNKHETLAEKKSLHGTMQLSSYRYCMRCVKARSADFGLTCWNGAPPRFCNSG